MNINIILGVLLILGLANGAPILAARIFGEWFAAPVDAGRYAADGHPWLGPSKTWRGIVSAFLLALPVALALGFSVLTSFSIIALSMCGDLCGSYIKRRFGMASSSRALGLDQIPEAGLPLVYLWLNTTITFNEAVVIVVLFIVTEILLSKLLYRLHIRNRPY